MRYFRSAAFTLVETVVVLAILGALVTGAVVGTTAWLNNSRVSNAQNLASVLDLKKQQYLSEQGDAATAAWTAAADDEARFTQLKPFMTSPPALLGDGVVSGAYAPTGFRFVLNALNSATSVTRLSDNSTVYPTGGGSASATRYVISAAPADTSMGTAVGGGTYTAGDTVTVNAAPYSGFGFIRWTEGAATVSTSPSYTFTASASRTLIAVFQATAPGNYSLTMLRNNALGGTISPGSGSYAPGSNVALGATPNSNWVFDSWSGDIGTANAASASISVTMDHDRTVQANFVRTAVTLTVAPNNPAMGATSGGGNFPSGTSITVVATAFPGYHFVNWMNGVTIVSTSSSWTTTVNANTALVATFALDPVTGVTPGIYGDSTHVGSFTVDAQGRIVDASNVAFADSGVVAGDYGSAASVPVFHVDAKGHVTSVTDTPINIPASAVSGLDPLYVKKSGDTMTGALTVQGVSTLSAGAVVGNEGAKGATLDVQTPSGTAPTMRLFQNGIDNWTFSGIASAQGLQLKNIATTIQSWNSSGTSINGSLSVKQGNNSITGGFRTTRSDTNGYSTVYMGSDDKLYFDNRVASGGGFEWYLNATRLGGWSAGGLGIVGDLQVSGAVSNTSASAPNVYIDGSGILHRSTAAFGGGSFVDKTGDTMTGNLVISGANPYLKLDRTDATGYNGIQFKTGGATTGGWEISGTNTVNQVLNFYSYELGGVVAQWRANGVSIYGTVIASGPVYSPAGVFTADSGAQPLRIVARAGDDYAWAPMVFKSDGTTYQGGMAWYPGGATIFLGSSLASAADFSLNGLSLSGDKYTRYGPNSSWGQYLRVGGNGRTSTTDASVVTTNGNLHLDSADGRAIFLNYYSNGPIYAGSGTHTVMHSGNFNSYVPTLTGGGASGTWPISVNGNAGSSSTLQNGATLPATVYLSGGNPYRIAGNQIFVDTLESGVDSDWLELVFSSGQGVRVGTGANGSKPLYASNLFAGGNQVLREGVASGSYGSFSAPGSLNGWSGVHFPDAGRVFMVRNSDGYSGIYREANGSWLWGFDNNGSLISGSVPWASITGRPALPSGNWVYSGQGGQPTWLWGTNDGTNNYVWNPSNFSVARAQRANGNFYIDDNYGNGIVGVYASTRYQGVFAMGDAYKLAADGTSMGSLYGLAWTHENVGGQSKAGLQHQLLVAAGGATWTALGYGIWTIGNATIGGSTTSTSFRSTSTGRFKANIQPIKGAMDLINQIEGVYYDGKEGTQLAGQKHEPGFIAEAVGAVIPEIVGHDEKGLIDSVDYSRLTPFLVEAMKVTARKQERTTGEIDTLKQELTALRNQVAGRHYLTALEIIVALMATLAAGVAVGALWKSQKSTSRAL